MSNMRTEEFENIEEQTPHKFPETANLHGKTNNLSNLLNKMATLNFYY